MDIFDVDEKELQKYIYAYQLLPLFKDNKESFFNSLYDDCYSQGVYIDMELGRITRLSVDVEKIAITIIERKEEFENQLKKLERLARSFESALNTLSICERNAIKKAFFERTNDTELTFEHTFYQVKQKLCNAIRQQQIFDFNQKKLNEKRKRIEKIKYWKL